MKRKPAYLKWQSDILSGKQKVIYRPTPDSRKSLFYLYFLVQRLLGYYSHRVELILENRVIVTPARYGLIAIDEPTRDRMIKGSWISSL